MKKVVSVIALLFVLIFGLTTETQAQTDATIQATVRPFGLPIIGNVQNAPSDGSSAVFAIALFVGFVIVLGLRRCRKRPEIGEYAHHFVQEWF